MFKVILSSLAVKDLKNLRKTGGSDFLRIQGLLTKMHENPLMGDIRKLRNFPYCEYRVRSGKYRVLFDIDLIEKQVVIYRIVHRKDSYR